MRLIKLSQNQYMKCDDDDYNELIKYKWFANFLKNTGSYYARTNIILNGKKTLISPANVLFGDYQGCCDHINHDTLDNRRENLRICTTQQNNRNKSKQKKQSSSIYKGVSFYRPLAKWRAHIRINGVLKHIGYFEHEEDAAMAYNQKATEIFGQFAKLNSL